MKLSDIGEELRTIYSVKVLDATLPPLIYILISTLFDLKAGIIVALLFSSIIIVIRLYKKQSFKYSIGGLTGVVFASLLAFLSESASNFFLPKAIGSGIFLAIIILSILIRKPLTAWVSHLTRGWALEWYWRKDILPAYIETTIIWGIFISIRLTMQIILFINNNLIQQGVFNVILGIPLTIVILVITYIYGIWRLKSLKGPGIDEYVNNVAPPWRGQIKGF